MDLLNLCLTLKDFQYNGKQCKQLNGNSYGLSSFCCCSRNRYAKHQNIEEQSLATYRRTIAAQSRHRRKPSLMLFLYLGIWWSRWIVPRAFRTFHEQSPVHIRILTMFTGIFRVKGGGRFKAITLSFLTVVVFQCRCSSLGSQLQHHSQKPLPPPHPSPSEFSISNEPSSLLL